MIAKSKIAFAFWIVLASLYVGYKGIIPGWNDTATDFNNYYASAKLLQQGEPIHSFYSNQDFSRKAKRLGIESGAKFSPFPPPTTVLYWPVSFFDLLTAKRIWLVLNLILLCLLPFRMRDYFKSSVLENTLVLSLFFVPLSSNLHFGQFYFVTAFLLMEAVGYFHSTKKRVFSSVLIAGLAAVKYIPILFLGYLLKFSKDALKPIGIVALTISIITGIFLLVDFESYGMYLSDLGGHVNGDLPGQGKYAIGFQSADALLNNLFVFDAIENPHPFWDFELLKPVLKWSLIGSVGLCCLMLFKRDRYAFSSSTVSIGIIGAFVLIPASASYHFLLLILPVFFILKWIREERGMKELAITIALIVGAFTIQSHQIPNIEDWPLFNLFIHFPRLWFILALFSHLIFTKRSMKNG